MSGASFSRREFMAASAAGVMLSRAALGANDRIRLGLIGTGERMGSHLNDLAKLKKSHNVTVTAVCDVWKPNLARASERVKKDHGKKPFETARFGELLKRKDVDAVIIATPDFSHTPIMIEALKAGKDVYVEKPMSQTVEEANTALDLAREKKLVVQVGTQYRGEGRQKAARDFIASGRLGHVSRISAANCFNQARWARDFADCKEKDVDWEAYLLNRPKVDFDPKLLRRWHLYKMCCNGIAGLWMVHLVDQAHMIMNASYPDAAVALGNIYVWKDGREHTDLFHALLDYPEGFLFEWCMNLTNAAGTHYTLHGQHGTLDLLTLQYGDEGGAGTTYGQGILQPPPDENHLANWLDCLRSRQRPNADIEFGHQHSVASIMAAAALESGQRQRYDREKRAIYPG